MAKLAPPKKASKPTAPKKPSTRSKTGNAACSEAASNWQLSLRGKASLNPETYRTLAKCRAMNRTAKMAEAQGRTGKLSAMGESAVKGRLQARFDSGLITQKARTERLDILLKQRSQQKPAAKPEAPKPAFSLKADNRPAGMTSKNQGSFFQSETDIEKAVRLENAAKPKPLPGQGDMFDVTTQRLAPTVSAARVLSPMASKLLKSVVKGVKGKLLARAESSSGVATLRTEAIKADPERFQYKMNTSGPVGVTDQFKETKVWNRELAGVVQVWKDPANGQTFVVNGHHRFELAQRLGVKRLNVQYIQAKDAAEARTKGALTNIAEGRGTSVDAGKFFREQGDLDGVVETLKKRGISLSEKTAGEGLALAKTAPKIWRDVVDEMTPVSRAVAIGKADLRHEDQLQIYRKATEGNWRSGKTAEFATELKRAPLVKTGSASLFGDDEFVNTAEHRAAIADRFKTQLKSGKKLFGTVARSKNAGRLESAGNQIDRAASAAIAESNDRALMAFDIERKFGSRTSILLDKAAMQLAKGEKIDKVYAEFERRAGRALARDIEKPIGPRLAKRKSRLAALAR